MDNKELTDNLSPIEELIRYYSSDQHNERVNKGLLLTLLNDCLTKQKERENQRVKEAVIEAVDEIREEMTNSTPLAPCRNGQQYYEANKDKYELK